MTSTWITLKRRKVLKAKALLKPGKKVVPTGEREFRRAAKGDGVDGGREGLREIVKIELPGDGTLGESGLQGTDAARAIARAAVRMGRLKRTADVGRLTVIPWDLGRRMLDSSSALDRGELPPALRMTNAFPAGTPEAKELAAREALDREDEAATEALDNPPAETCGRTHRSDAVQAVAHSPAECPEADVAERIAALGTPVDPKDVPPEVLARFESRIPFEVEVVSGSPTPAPGAPAIVPDEPPDLGPICNRPKGGVCECEPVGGSRTDATSGPEPAPVAPFVMPSAVDLDEIAKRNLARYARPREVEVHVSGPVLPPGVTVEEAAADLKAKIDEGLARTYCDECGAPTSGPCAACARRRLEPEPEPVPCPTCRGFNVRADEVVPGTFDRAPGTHAVECEVVTPEELALGLERCAWCKAEVDRANSRVCHVVGCPVIDPSARGTSAERAAREEGRAEAAAVRAAAEVARAEATRVDALERIADAMEGLRTALEGLQAVASGAAESFQRLSATIQEDRARDAGRPWPPEVDRVRRG